MKVNGKDVAEILGGPVGYVVVGAVVIGVLYYFGKELLDQVKKGFNFASDKVGGPIAAPIAGAIVATNNFFNPGVTVRGQVLLPTGEIISINDIVTHSTGVDSGGNFVWSGKRYLIIGRDQNDNYVVA